MDQNIEELLQFYALDALNDEDRALVEAYLNEHPEIRERIHELSRAAAALPYSAPLVRPSERSKQLLMERIEADQRAPSQPNWLEVFFLRFNKLAFGAWSLAVAVLAIGWVFILQQEVSRLREKV